MHKKNRKLCIENCVQIIQENVKIHIQNFDVLKKEENIIST